MGLSQVLRIGKIIHAKHLDTCQAHSKYSTDSSYDVAKHVWKVRNHHLGNYLLFLLSVQKCDSTQKQGWLTYLLVVRIPPPFLCFFLSRDLIPGLFPLYIISDMWGKSFLHSPPASACSLFLFCSQPSWKSYLYLFLSLPCYLASAPTDKVWATLIFFPKLVLSCILHVSEQSSLHSFTGSSQKATLPDFSLTPSLFAQLPPQLNHHHFLSISWAVANRAPCLSFDFLSYLPLISPLFCLKAFSGSQVFSPWIKKPSQFWLFTFSILFSLANTPFKFLLQSYELNLPWFFLPSYILFYLFSSHWVQTTMGW